jgi:hypothetical protein
MQTAPVTIPPWVTPAMTTALLGGVVWVIRTLMRVDTRLERVDVALYGEKGHDGLTSRVDALEEKTDDHGERLVAIETKQAMGMLNPATARPRHRE